MKQSKKLHGDLKPGHKKTTKRTTMSPTADVDRHRPPEADWGGSSHLDWGPAHCHAKTPETCASDKTAFVYLPYFYENIINLRSV